MKKILIVFGLCLYSALNINAITPLWLRDVAISPDGTQVAFCYKGDIWSVPTTGGQATRLTTMPSYESCPVWSFDGSSIAFASDRNGGNDVYIMSSKGGNAKRLTFNSASEIPSSFTPDGTKVLFSAAIQDPAESALFPKTAMTELYSVSVEGGKAIQMLATPAEKVNWCSDGKFFVYQDNKGVESEWRKHHTSSVTRDLWYYDVASQRHINLTNHQGEDRDPVLSADGKTMFFLSEVAGKTMNLWSMPVDASSQKAEIKGGEVPASWTQLTNFETHPVRFLSYGGGILCLTWNGEIYTMRPGGAPTKLQIDLTVDEDNLLVTSDEKKKGRASVSPDGKQIAFIARGEVFVTSVDYKTTKKITNTAAAERNVDFGHDNRTLVYSSERDGVSQLYLAKISRKEDPNFPNATLITEEPLLPDLSIERGKPSFSPDGKEVAFIENRTKLMVVNLETKAVRQITDGSQCFDMDGNIVYTWSPDGKWFAIEYTPNRHDPYYDVGIVSAKEGGEIINITQSGYMSGSPRWTMDGNALMFYSEIYGMRAQASWGSQDDVYLCFMNQETFDKFNLSKEDYELQKESEKKDEKEKPAEAKENGKKSKKDGKFADEKADKAKSINIEFDGIQDRIVRLTPNSSSLSDAIITKDGQTMYYLASFEDDMDLWKLDLRKHETKLISKGAGSASFDTDGDGKTIFLLGKTMKKLDGDNLKPITYDAKVKINPYEEREAMFDYVYNEERNRFYTVDMHGVDWDAMTEAYRKFLPHISNNYDFAELLSELLGELNVSHTGGRYYPELEKELTAHLGLLFDMNYTGKGAKVVEIVKGGPFDHAKLNLKPGDVLTHINGTEITPEQDLSILLAGLANKKTLVTAEGGAEYVVIPVTSSKMNDLLYTRWIKQRAADVEKWSNGRLGYVHIREMNDNSFRPLYSDVLGKYNKCDGIVIDTRFNGGGRMHEDIEAFFTGEKYLTQVVRGRESCDMPSRRWNKPSIMLQCEANYSNAHGTPWVYSHQHIGKLVGAPVPGTMTSVNWVTMQDPTLVFGIPVVGYRTEDGSYLEGKQLEPDIYVLNSPETIVKGEDTQLRRAVDELLKEIDSKKQ